MRNFAYVGISPVGCFCLSLGLLGNWGSSRSLPGPVPPPPLPTFSGDQGLMPGQADTALDTGSCPRANHSRHVQPKASTMLTFPEP